MCKGKHKKKKIRINDLAIKSALLVATLSKMNCRWRHQQKRRKMQLSGFSCFLKVRITLTNI